MSDCFRWGFLAVGICALGFSGYVYLDSHVYQAYEEWSFSQSAQGKASTVGGFLRAEAGGADTETGREVRRPQTRGVLNRDSDQALIGRIEIPRLRLHAIVREGVDDRTLRRAVGHVPGTAKPGAEGNVGLAGHRDSFFRQLHDVRKEDRIVLETLDATYEYTVDSLKIVGPKDVSVLAPTEAPSLTLVTCYPFHYVGNAPRRFIVRARQVSVEARSGAAGPGRTGL